jgi:hypothetical protein
MADLLIFSTSTRALWLRRASRLGTVPNSEDTDIGTL